MQEISKQPLILFDGVCNLCDNAVKYVLKRDTKKVFYFSSLQSEYSKKTLLKFNKSNEDLDTIILIFNNTIYTESSAVIKIAEILGKQYSLMIIFYVIPKTIRDKVYSFIAKNRYKWFGKKEACMIPTLAVQNRFID